MFLAVLNCCFASEDADEEDSKKKNGMFSAQAHQQS
jgi:hypothetical protein